MSKTACQPDIRHPLCLTRYRKEQHYESQNILFHFFLSLKKFNRFFPHIGQKEDVGYMIGSLQDGQSEIISVPHK